MKSTHFLLTILVFSILTSFSFAATWAVNVSGQSCVPDAAANYSGIQLAINFPTVMAGDTIIVCSNGSSGYSENIFVNKTINLYGNESGVIINSADTTDVMIIAANGVNISNFTVTGATTSSDSGFYVNESASNVSITDSTSHGNLIGLRLQNTESNTFSSLNLSNNTNYGVTNVGSNLSSFTSLDIRNSTYGFNLLNSNSNNLSSSTIFNISTYGVQLTTSNSNTFTSNQIHNGTGNVSGSEGIRISTSNSTTLSLNNVSGYYYGIRLRTSSNFNNLTSNNVTAAKYVIYLESPYNTFTSNNVHGTTLSSGHGFYLSTTPDYNNFTTNNAYNNTGAGFSSNGGDFNIFNSNTLYNNGQFGFSFLSSDDNNFTSNTLYNHTQSAGFAAMRFATSYNTTLTNNIMYDNLIGVGCYSGCNFTAFSGNNITNATDIGISVTGESSYVTFTGNNWITSIPSSAWHIQMNDSANLSTATYNITDSNLNFGLNTSYNISLTVSNLSSFNTVTSVSDSSGSSLVTGSEEVVQSAQSNYFALNVTNTSANSSFSPTMFYLASDKPTMFSGSNFGIGKTNTAGSWTFYTATEDTSAASLKSTGITSFSLFAPLYYLQLLSGGSEESSGGSGSLGQLEVDTQVVCENHSIVATVTDSSGDPVSGAEVFVRVQNGAYVSGSPFTTNSDGKIEFTNPVHGTTYEFQADKSPDYEESLKVYETYECFADAISLDYSVDVDLSCDEKKVTFQVFDGTGRFLCMSDPLVSSGLSTTPPPQEDTGSGLLDLDRQFDQAYAQANQFVICTGNFVYYFDEYVEHTATFSKPGYETKTITADASFCSGEVGNFEVTSELNCEDKTVTFTPSTCAFESQVSSGLYYSDPCSEGEKCAPPCTSPRTYFFLESGVESITFTSEGFDDVTTVVDTSVCFDDGPSATYFDVDSSVSCDDNTVTFNIVDENGDQLCGVSHSIQEGDLTLISSDSECGSEYVYSFSEDQQVSAGFSYGLSDAVSEFEISCGLLDDVPDDPVTPVDPNDPTDDSTIEIPPGGELIIEKPDGKTDVIPNDGDTKIEYPISFTTSGDYELSVEVDGDVVASKTVTVLPAEDDNLLEYIQKNSVLCFSLLLLLIILGAFLWWRNKKDKSKRK